MLNKNSIVNGKGQPSIKLHQNKNNTGRNNGRKTDDEWLSQFAASRRQDINEFYEVVAGNGNQRGLTQNRQIQPVFPGKQAQQKRINIGNAHTSENTSSPLSP